ncbi:prephenate dehydratase [Endomicrobium proavitum]|uniref:Bifunctional chorismate mutase/prephenate dehydratase n=1 Tax=Endomicrobium proavitum TaxID=1408281 RepID=A0A0G3WMD5_9BACT|nr:prephenate dehydratase [Endomicrobium proavitum]AKL98649.1 chorismate mutase/prephenate dehydratase [Endomicrobium proavitum]
MKTNLAVVRKNIDKTDREIARLLNKRARLALDVGKVKGKTGKAVYVPSREKEVLKNVLSALKKSKPVLSLQAIEDIYTEIISACRNLETPTKIAFLGPWATFTHQAAMKKFGSSGNFVPCATPGEVLDDVEKGRSDFGVVPVENSNEGSVNVTLDMLVETELAVCGEISLKIEQCFLVKDPKAKILRIYSHSHALAQCRTWLLRNYPDAELISVSSTAEAAKMAVKETHAAAVASEAAAKIYDLFVIEKGIQDSKQNFTRFFVIGKIAARPSGKDKTSLVFMIKDKPGALHKILESFEKNKINLTKIQSRPTKKKAWEYMFFVDLEGHVEDKNVAKAIKALKDESIFVKILGSYPVN